MSTSPAVFTNTNPVRPYRGNGRPEAAYVIERMVELAARELGIDPVELRRRNYIPPSAMPFKTGLTFTYDSGEFEKNMDLALKLADAKGFKARKAQSHKQGKLRGLGISNTIERAGAASLEGAEVRFDRSGTADALFRLQQPGPGPRDHLQATGLRPARASIRTRRITSRATPTQVPFGEGTGGSRSATLAGSAFHLATEKVVAKARAIAAHMLKVEESDLKFEEGVFSTEQDQSHAHHQGAGARFAQSGQPAGRHGAGPVRQRDLFGAGRQLSQRLPCLRGRDRPRDRQGRHRALQRGRRRRHGDESEKLLEGQIHGGIAQGAGQALMEDIHFDAAGQLVTASFMDYAMPRADDFCDITMETNPVPTKTNPLGVKGAGEAGCVGALPAVTNAVIDALARIRREGHRDAGHAGARLAGDAGLSGGKEGAPARGKGNKLAPIRVSRLFVHRVRA